MRLGEQPCGLREGSLAHELYQQPVVHERHRHRYEVNNHFIPQFEDAGLTVSGRSETDDLVEMIELDQPDWFVACQFSSGGSIRHHVALIRFSGVLSRLRTVTETAVN